MKRAPAGNRRLMSCLGDPSRFRLVRELARRARCVSDLAEEIGLSQSCTTRHLQVLARERLVEGKRDGKRVVFRLRDEDASVSSLVQWALSGAGAVPVTPATGDGRAGRRSSAARRERKSAAPRAMARVSAAPRRPEHAPTAPRMPEVAPVVEATANASSVGRVSAARPDPRPRATSWDPWAEDAGPRPRPRPARQDIEDYLL